MVARIDEAAAEQVARDALAKMLVNLKPMSVSEGEISYMAAVGNKKCKVEVAKGNDGEVEHWLLRKLDCKR